MIGAEAVSTAVVNVPSSASLALAIFAVLLYTALIVLVALTCQFGIGYSRSDTLCIKAVSTTLAAGMNIAIHIGFGGSLFFSLFSDRWTSNAYWLSIGTTLLAALWVILFTLQHEPTDNNGGSGSSRAGIAVGIFYLFSGMASEAIRHLSLIGISSLLYKLWWALQPQDWIVTCNIIAFYFGWALFLTFNLIPTLIESLTVPTTRGLAVPFGI